MLLQAIISKYSLVKNRKVKMLLPVNIILLRYYFLNPIQNNGCYTKSKSKKARNLSSLFC